MQKNNLISGRVVLVNSNYLLVARGPNLYIRSHDSQNLFFWKRLPVSWLKALLMRFSIVSRAFRLGIHHVACTRGKTVVVANKSTYLIEDEGVIDLGHLKGSRPMGLCAAEGKFFYGEYRSNSERSLVHIWGLDVERKVWLPVWAFYGVRHVHGVFYDPYVKAFWVTTGDTDEESAIWRTDDQFSSVIKIVGGTQQFRSVQLIFTEDYIYFGSDAPDEPNHIYRMARDGSNLEKLCPVDSSVFYGCKVGKYLVFSTAVEPSNVNTTREADVWYSVDGEKWERLISFSKDNLSMRYFQYGQVLFPNISGSDEETLYCTPFAVKGHGVSVKFEL